MKNDKLKSEKEELKNKTDASYSKKADELKFNDKIDDAYTNKLVNKYEKGHKKNLWFTSSGLLSMIFGALAIVVSIVVAIAFAIKGAQGSYDLDDNRAKLLTATFSVIVYGICSIVIGLKITTFADYTRDMLMAKTLKISFFAILQLFLGGIIFSIVTMVGYFVGRGIDYGAIYYNRIDGYNKNDNKNNGDIEQELRILKSEDNISSDEGLYLYHNQSKNI